jgi:general secretion pathway protein G
MLRKLIKVDSHRFTPVALNWHSSQGLHLESSADSRRSCESSELLRAEGDNLVPPCGMEGASPVERGKARAPLIEDRRGPVLAQRGFTLVEMLVVVAIVGLLLTLVGPKIMKGLGTGQRGAAKAQIELLGQALDTFRLDVGRYPTTQEGLSALITNPGVEKWDGPYLKKNAIPGDPWKKPYTYQCPGTHGEYDLYSYGPDGTQGGDGENKDIVSWE